MVVYIGQYITKIQKVQTFAAIQEYEFEYSTVTCLDCQGC